MIQLRRNGIVVEVGGAEIVRVFEERIARWNDEWSGWSADGTWWTVCELPDITEFQSTFFNQTVRLYMFFNEWVPTEHAIGYIIGANVVPKLAEREVEGGTEYSTDEIICPEGHVFTADHAVAALRGGVVSVLVWEWCTNDGTDPELPVVEFLGEEMADA